MPVSIVLPHKEGDILNVPVHDVEDECLVIEGLGSGEGRVAGAERAVNEWLILADADASYPKDYVSKAKTIIASEKYPIGFKARRIGGLPTSQTHEAGTIVRRDIFLARTKGFVPNGRWDVGYRFLDLPTLNEIWFSHGLTFSERSFVATAGVTALGVGALWWLGREK